MKVGREAFIYLDGYDKNFAQCSTCFMWSPDKELCAIHGTDVDITGTMSCCFYVEGIPSAKKFEPLVTPEESGLVDRKVRCENCLYGDKRRGECNLYKTLNEELPDIFELDVNIVPRGCCNAQTPLEDEEDDDGEEEEETEG